MRQEEGLAPVVCLLSCFLGLHHVIQWGGSDDPKSWTCPEDSWPPSSAQVPELPGSTVVWMLPVLRPKSVPYWGAFPGLLQSSSASRLMGPREAERAPGVGVEEGMPRPALSRLWRRVVTEEGVRPAPEGSVCISRRWRKGGPTAGLQWCGRRGPPQMGPLLKAVWGCVHVHEEVHLHSCPCEAPQWLAGLRNSLG